MKTFKTVNIGCKVNAYELSAIASLLLKEGFIENSEHPDVIIINTCSVTATADQKSRQHIRKMQKLYPNAVIAVMGCYVQGNCKFIQEEIKPDILLGTSHRREVVTLIKKALMDKGKYLIIDEDTRSFSYEELGITSHSENIRAFLKIQDGCNNFCTYCIVPFLRGKMRSRNKENVIKEAEYLISKGYKEIVLSGIHVGGYGQDLISGSFSSLVEELSDLPGLNSLRISSIEESEIDDHLIQLLIEKDNLAKHLHIPLQSGSNRLLKLMNRRYDRESFIKRILEIKELVPDILISSDVIVGFPSENEEDFMDTYHLCEQCFDMLHVFSYSARPGTIAAKMDGRVHPSLKKERSKRLIELSNKLYQNYANRFVGKPIKVLIEKYDQKEKVNIGHTTNYLEVKIPSKESKVGQFITIKLQKSMIQSK
ncbi:MAG TPA: tRNA (N(6)-L-threonylcarbamoyladenosine(37)-C(2))-methylthiotransferase MtaB [Erysipelotrichaceae bacterium]|nr:tRNA (N(6)-L-threonylcarbamoyladenosine(37)-C(2))-methylthiotransferase MtaB [Erysipelotrichaceae bacterium]